MTRTYVHWALAAMVGFSAWMSTGCIGGVHQHRISGTFEYADQAGTVSGTVDSVDIGIVADFRYLRLAFPFEGYRRDLQLINREGGTLLRIDEMIENRTLRLDLPLLTLKDFASEPSGKRYPGSIRRRHGLELWASGSVGAVPLQPVTTTASLVYYRYGVVAVRLFGGWSYTPFEGVARTFEGGAEQFQRIRGYAAGGVAGIEVTLFAGEYALEMIQYLLEYDRVSRETSRRR